MWTIEDVNATKIQPKDILYLVTEMSQLCQRGEKPDWEAAIFLLFKRFEKNRETCADKALCIMERMRCLSEIAKDERMRGWTMDCRDKDCTLTNEAIFHAAAFCAVRERDGKGYFDPEEFFGLALTELPSEGRA